jgi:NADPH:quinone reductase-like Zn-dependent oxidoreductase
VFALIDFDRDGAAADYVTVPAAHLAVKPASASDIETATARSSGASARDPSPTPGRSLSGGFDVIIDTVGGATLDASYDLLAALVDDGSLRAIVSQTFPVSEGRRAFESAREPRPPGKTVLIVR